MRKIILLCGSLCLILATLFMFSQTPSSSPSSSPQRAVCLNMIVKNEEKVIARCLESAKRLIDYWVIIDTGSSDRTIEVIKECMKGIPGEVHQRPWVNFEHNRNEALQLAKDKAAYTLFLDADEVLEFDQNFQFPSLDKDLYSIHLKQKGAADSIKWFMIKNSLNWRWEGVLHETIRCPEARTEELVKGVANFSDTSLGARSRNPKKYLDDAKVLEAELAKDPNQPRYQFYLATSYLNAADLEQALKHFSKRAEMQGEQGEVFISLLLKARLLEHFQADRKTILEAYQRACEHTPSRAEPLFYLAFYHLNQGNAKAAYDILLKAPTFPPTDYIFFVEQEIYDWRAPYFLAKACLQLKKYKEMQLALERVLKGKMVPQDVLEESKKNLEILTNLVHEHS